MNDRFEVVPGQPTMKAVVTVGNGDYDKLEYRDVPVPRLEPGDALLQVLAAGVNNTEINTRLGWYSRSVTGATSDAAEAQQEQATARHDGGWNETTPFPLIQGTDCCGRVVEVAQDVDEQLLGQRALVRPCMHLQGFSSLQHVWMASDLDGAFAQFLRVPATEVFPIESDWSDEELATIPCAYGTAENMLHRVATSKDDRVLVTGASGGVGSAAVQLAKRRGARVTAVCGEAKKQLVSDIGADQVFGRDEDLVAALGDESVDVVIDIVAGQGFGALLKVLKRGGRYTTAGAIAGPIVSLDVRDLYLKDLTMVGCTAWDEPVFPNLVAYLQRGEIRPLLAKTFPLSQIVDAQQEFLEKRHVGKIVLLPPPAAGGVDH